MNIYNIKFINKNNELVSSKTVAANRIEAKNNIKISFDVKEIVEVE